LPDEPPRPIDSGPIKPNPEARYRPGAALRAHPAGLELIDAACALLDPDRVPALRRDVGLWPAHDALAMIRMEAANAVLGALQDEERGCELHFLRSGLGEDFVAATAAAIGRLNFFALDLAKSEIVTKEVRFPARIVAKPVPLDAPAQPTGQRQSAKAAPVKTPTKQGAIKNWIAQRYPGGIRAGTTLKQIVREFSNETEITVSERTVRRARGGK
jgi:hypothetical protein